MYSLPNIDWTLWTNMMKLAWVLVCNWAKEHPMFLAHFKVADVWMSNRCTLLKPRHSLSFPLTWGGINIVTWYCTINTKNRHSTHLRAPVNWHAQPLCLLEPIKFVVFLIASPRFRSAIFLPDKTPIGFRTTLRSQVEPLRWKKYINT